MILVVLICIAQPRLFSTQGLIFVNILSTFACKYQTSLLKITDYCKIVHIATSTAILIADYWVIRKWMWKVPDLYAEGGIYWYTAAGS